jgi:thioesterase domain-containing protein
MARQLVALGRDVRLVAIIDSGPPRADAGTIMGSLAAIGLFLQNAPRWLSTAFREAYTRAALARFWRSAKNLVRQVSGGCQTAREIFDVSAWPPELIVQANTNLRALARYRYGPYDGRIVLFRARTSPLFHSHGREFGWRAFARGGLEVVDLPGSHGTVTTEPHVQVLARALRESLEQAMERRPAAR